MNSEKKHIEQFVESFIRREFRDRWIHILCEKPGKAKEELRKFESHCDPRYCRIVENTGQVLEQIHPATKGLYLNGLTPPKFASLGEAIAETSDMVIDAIFSIYPGNRAVFFFHEGWAWICEKDRVCR